MKTISSAPARSASKSGDSISASIFTDHVLDPAFTPQLDALGEEGWELVGLTSVNFKSGATDNLALIFKRPVAT